MSNVDRRTLVFASNASMELYSDNKPYNFKVHLARPLDLEGDWEVAILKIDYINDWKTIDKMAVFEIVRMREDDDGTYKNVPFEQDTYTFEGAKSSDYWATKLEPAHYDTVEDIIKILNDNIYLRMASLERIPGYRQNDKPTLEADFNIPKILGNLIGKKYIADEEIIIKKNNDKFSELEICPSETVYNGILYAKNKPAQEIIKLLGFNFDNEIEHSIKLPVYNKYMPTVNKYPFVFVYTDIIDPDMVGDYFVPLLDEFPVKGKYGESSHWDFHEPIYHRVNKRYISTVELQLSTHYGELFPINTGPTLITLNFRKCARM